MAIFCLPWALLVSGAAVGSDVLNGPVDVLAETALRDVAQMLELEVFPFRMLVTTRMIIYLLGGMNLYLLHVIIFGDAPTPCSKKNIKVFRDPLLNIYNVPGGDWHPGGIPSSNPRLSMGLVYLPT